MTIIKELCVVARKYTDKNGQEKSVWKNIGAIHTSTSGKEYMVLDPMVNLAAVPRKDGDDRVFVSMFEPKQKQNVQQAATQSNPMEDMDSDIPF